MIVRKEGLRRGEGGSWRRQSEAKAVKLFLTRRAFCLASADIRESRKRKVDKVYVRLFTFADTAVMKNFTQVYDLIEKNKN